MGLEGVGRPSIPEEPGKLGGTENQANLEQIDEKVKALETKVFQQTEQTEGPQGKKYVPQKQMAKTSQKEYPRGLQRRIKSLRKNLDAAKENKNVTAKEIKKMDRSLGKAENVLRVANLGIRDDISIREAPKKPSGKVGISHEAPRGYSPDERDRILSRGADIRTAQGINAEVFSATVNACLVSHMAKLESPVFSTVSESAGTLSPQEQFIGVMNTIEKLLDSGNFEDESTCEMANKLANQLGFTFSYENGGVGSFSQPGWNSEWNDIGGKDAFAPDSPDNDQVKESFKEMLTYFKANAPDQFGGGERHVGGREFACIQTACTVGMLLNDYVLEQAYSSDVRDQLASIMSDENLIHSDFDMDSIDSVKDSMRQNPLLAEIKNSVYNEKISKRLNVQKNKDRLVGLIKKELKTLDTGNKLSDKELNELSNKVFDNFSSRVVDIKHKTFKTGARGRLPFQRGSALGKNLGKTLAGERGLHYSMADQPNRANDQLSNDWTKATFGDDLKVSDFFEATEGKHGILKHKPGPLRPLRYGSGLATSVAEVLDPGTLLRGAIEDTISAQNLLKGDPYFSFKEIQHLEDKVMTLEKAGEDVGSAEFKKGFQEIVGNIDIPFNSLTKQKIKLQKFAEMDSVAQIMYNNDIRAICSISGTTVDVILGQTSIMGKEKVKELLLPLLNHLEGKGKEPGLNSEEGQKFREFATSIASFMQTGQYHTAGEVIGGLYMAAKGLHCTPKEFQDIDKTVGEFSKLMSEFSKSPEEFLAVNDLDKQKIKKGKKGFKKMVVAAEKERIAQRSADVESMTAPASKKKPSKH
ncbi:MAG: hypothetical protein K940chlam3_00861 [Chlamydiae bacterium]|nr:hypothetical protein [Chlamydiota bacterium]